MFRRSREVSTEPPIIDLEHRSPKWLDFATVSSVSLGIAEIVVGTIGRSNALLANSVEMFDNTTYGLDSLAARDEKNRRRNHRLRRTAGGIITMAALGVAANSAYDMQAHEVPDVSSYAAGFAAVGIALNGSYVLGLKKDADSGTTHRDGFRHGASDTISSAVAVGAIIAANHGYPAVDTYASLGMCASTIIFTFPTNRRIESADRVYANVQSESESAAGEESMS